MSFFVYAVQRQGRTGVVVDVLVEVEFVIPRDVSLRESGLYLNLKGLVAAVAGDRERARDRAFDIYRGAVTHYVTAHVEICLQDVWIAEAFKELLADLAVELYRSGT